MAYTESMKNVIDLNSRRPGWVYDEVCGIWYDAKGMPQPKPEFMVITKKPGPSGLCQLCATFDTRANALRWQAKNGRIQDTTILEI